MRSVLGMAAHTGSPSLTGKQDGPLLWEADIAVMMF